MASNKSAGISEARGLEQVGAQDSWFMMLAFGAGDPVMHPRSEPGSASVVGRWA